MATQYEGWSIVAQYRKCGKSGCKTCAEDKGHGPYYYGTKIVDGQRMSKYFGKTLPVNDIQDDTQDNIVNGLRRLLLELQRENKELHALVAQLRSQLDVSLSPASGELQKVDAAQQSSARDTDEAVGVGQRPAMETTERSTEADELTRDDVDEI
jgi:hypothetical protein